MTEAWATRMKSVHTASTVTSLLAALSGFCILRGRWYWVALFGCVAAMTTVGQACCIPGTIAGLWGILALVRDDGRAHFGIRPNG